MAEHLVELPGGGSLKLNDADEVKLWKNTARKYLSDYGITRQNDLVLLGALLSQILVMYRAQKDISHEKKAASTAQVQIAKAATEIRELEKALGIDKKTRELGGKHTVMDYITNLKRAAHEKGVHISKRVKAYEEFAMDLRWRIRLLHNGDEEDRAYHNLSEDKILKWAEQQLAELEELDKQYANEKGRLYVGKM